MEIDKIPESTGELITIGAKVVAPLWSPIWKSIEGSVADKLLGRWKIFEWKHAEEKYLNQLTLQLNSTRLLGYSQPIEIDKIFTDVYVLSGQSAKKFYNAEIDDIDLDEMRKRIELERREARQIVSRHDRLYVLGKPGSGKTTLLKFLCLEAARGRFSKTPIFISLKEFSESSVSLLEFIEKQFGICGFPEGRLAINALLENGQALIAFDGLDEVSVEGDLRRKVRRQVIDLGRKYSRVKICVSCRTAAEDYSFEAFTYVEVADFTPEQQVTLIKRWYAGQPKKLHKFFNEWQREEHKGLRDLAQTPLLLALMCLGFDENTTFPIRKTDLYKEAIDALLKKWDSSRDIVRDTAYKSLTPTRKETLLSRIAFELFVNKRYLFKPPQISATVHKFFSNLPPVESPGEVDTGNLLKAIEAQHGLIVERYSGIYSFSHLTFHEYLVARYFVANHVNELPAKLLAQDILNDDRWREVILGTASLVDDASDMLGHIYHRALDAKLRIPYFNDLLIFVEAKRHEGKKSFSRMDVIRILERHCSVHDEKMTLEEVKEFTSPALAILQRLSNKYKSRQDQLGQRNYRSSLLLYAVVSEVGDFVARTRKRNFGLLIEYLRAIEFLLDCLTVSSAEKRQVIERSFFAHASKY